MDDSVFIEIPSVIRSQVSVINNLPTFSDVLRKFLTDLIDITHTLSPTENDTYIVSRKKYQDYAISAGGKASDPLVSKRLKSLVDLEVAQLNSHFQGGRGRGRINHYLLKDMTVLIGKPGPYGEQPADSSRRGRRSQAVVLRQKELFKADRNLVYLQGVKSISVFFHEQIFNGILDAAMRLSHKDDRKEIVVRTTLAGYPITITANCTSSKNSDVAVLTDQRAMRAIISYCRKEILSRVTNGIKLKGEDFDRQTIPNLFTIDINDLCFLMGMTNGSLNLDIIVGMMQRLADTGFKVDATENPWFVENFSIYPDGSVMPASDTFDFRFLTNFSIAHENKVVGDLFGKEELTELRPIFYTFSLEYRLFSSLLHSTTNLFLSHDKLSSERSGIIQRFYNWARAFISGRDKKGAESKWYSMSEMHEHLTPAARYDNFRTYFLRALKKFDVENNSVGSDDDSQLDDATDSSDEGSGTKKKRNQIPPFRALVYGYYVSYDRRDGVESFRFERDRSDPIVGDNSRHNQMLRRDYALIQHE